MEEIEVVLDTNVLHAGLYSSRGGSYRILQLVEQGVVKLNLSTTLLFEYEEVLKRHTTMLRLTGDDIEQLLNYLCQVSTHHRISYLWRPCLKDPKDDHILELAVAAKAPLIVTHNVKDFHESTQFGIRAVTPRLFLEELT
ncbi:MAG: putative toxin-antitoxin system toxin component, PIN family [Nitrospirales bacterium]|nr:putative toxin-antitoxin system toxin component, PIN family [Nitrospira sp.]MDR4501706.1 putative toxin-antitoxin system toxin component, PIN family [Nitrospirales bacterium]